MSGNTACFVSNTCKESLCNFRYNLDWCQSVYRLALQMSYMTTHIHLKAELEKKKVWGCSCLHIFLLPTQRFMTASILLSWIRNCSDLLQCTHKSLLPPLQRFMIPFFPDEKPSILSSSPRPPSIDSFSGLDCLLPTDWANSGRGSPVKGRVDFM